MPTLAEIAAIGQMGRSRASEIAAVAFATIEVRPIVDAAASIPVADSFRAAVAAYRAAVGVDDPSDGLRQAVDGLVEAARPLDIDVRADQLVLEAFAVPIDGVAVLGPDFARAATGAARTAIALVEAIERMSLLGPAPPRLVTRDTPFEAPGPLTDGLLRRWAVIRVCPDEDLRRVLAGNDADDAAATMLRTYVSALVDRG